MNLAQEIEEAIFVLKAFLSNSGGEWDFDDWISTKSKNDQINILKKSIYQIGDRYPPSKDEGFCNESGVIEIQKIIGDLEISMKGE